MTIPNNVVDVPHVDSYAGVTHADDDDFKAYEIERRIKEIFLRWLLIYFSGDPWSYHDPVTDSAVVQTFEHCDCYAGEATMKNPLPRPVIHAVASDHQRKVLGVEDALEWKSMDVKWNIYVRSAPGLVGSEPHIQGEFLSDMVASQLASLLEGDEIQGLADRGLADVNILRGPVPIQNAHYNLNQLVVAMKAYYHVPYNLAR